MSFRSVASRSALNFVIASSMASMAWSRNLGLAGSGMVRVPLDNVAEARDR